MIKQWWKLNGPQRLAWTVLAMLCVGFWLGLGYMLHDLFS